MSHSHKPNSIEDSESSPSNVDVIVACAQCSGGSSGIKGTIKRSRFSLEERSAPLVPPKVIITRIPPRDGSKGFLGKDIKFTEDRAKEVLEHLPKDQNLGEEPSGPCAYEVSQFLVCASQRDNLKECEAIIEDLQKCKEKNL